MGQMALGLLYGIEATDLQVSDDEGWPLEDLRDRFHAAAGLPLYPPSVEHEPDGGDKQLLGVWIAIGGSGKPNVPYFGGDAVPLAELPTLYADRMAYAHTTWEQFARYCAEQEQLVLPPATLWLTPTEVA